MRRCFCKSLAWLLIGALPWLGVAPLAGDESNSQSATPALKPRESSAQSPHGVGRALLVGCTRYDNSPQDSLLGPAHDVDCLWKLLTTKFHFDPRQITVLTEGGKDGRPIRKNIELGLQKLVDNTRPGDRVVIYLSGHGTRQPTTEESKKNDPDGFDEVFLPADVSDWDPAEHSIHNALVDDDLGKWLELLCAKNASCFVIIDACQSGGMIRGGGQVRARGIPPERFIPRDVLAKARKVTPRALGSSPQRAAPFDLPPDPPELVAIYGAPSWDSAYEMPLPPNAEKQETSGLMTFALVKVLTESAPLTYRQLAARMSGLYLSWSLHYSFPLIEGRAIDNYVLNDQSAKPPREFLLSGDDDAGWFINGGQMHGVADSNVLSVAQPAVSDNEQREPPVVGYVQIDKGGTDMLRAQVTPVEYRNLPPPQLNSGMVAKPVFVDLTIHNRTVAVDPLSDERDVAGRLIPLSQAEQEPIKQALKRFRKESYVRLIDESSRADWLVRVRQRQAKEVYLAPRNGFGLMAGSEQGPALFGPGPLGPGLADWVEERLSRVVRAENLLSFSQSLQNSPWLGSNSLDIQLEVRRLSGPGDREGELVAWDKDGPHFQAGQELGFRVTNRGRLPAYVTLLYVDSAFGIDVYFPRSFGVDNLIERNGTMQLRAKVNAKTTGREQLVLIAVRADKQSVPVDFGFLAQPRLEAARAISAKHGAGSFDSPLGKLFQNGLFGAGTTRGLDVTEGGQYATQVAQWTVEPKSPPK